jgi:NADH:ubiquinone oxidoreductase subunit 3 (subunit A)
MRTQGTLLILVSLFFIILTIAAANAQTTKWYKYEAGMEEASSTGKPALLEFYAKDRYRKKISYRILSHDRIP